jgi:hydroxyacylglutathione hydrolase
MNSFQVYQLYLKSMFFKNYCYIIMDTTTNFTAIVDPAWELATIEKLLKEINANLVTILLTHSHFDHVNLVKPLLERYNPQVVMSAKEIDYYKFTCPNLIPIENGDSLKLGNTDIKCLLTPGHTAGSTCFLLSDSLFTGDTIFTEGCGSCNTVGGSPEEMYSSIQMIKNTVPPDIFIYPGHSYGKTPGHSLNHLLKENIYFHIDKLEHFISFRMRKNQSNLLNFY